MLAIQPFRGIRYDVGEAGLPKVLAPPYDVIAPVYRDELYARDERNIIRVILNRTPGEAGYAEAGETFRRLLREEVLVQESEPALYLLEQSFLLEGATRRRYGVLARFRAEDPARRVILPHEQTRPEAREDRYRVLLATRANFSPIFLMFPDPGHRFAQMTFEAMSAAPWLRYTDDAGTGHRLWVVREAGTIERFQGLLGGTKAYIADGHHRHATALRYRDETGPDGAWTFGYFTPMEAPGLVVLPYHRLLTEGPSLTEARRRLAERFRLTPVDDVAAAAGAVAASQAERAFALVEPGGGAVVAEARADAESLLPPGAAPCLRALDTFFLHHAVLGPLLGVDEGAVRYVHSQAEAEEALRLRACRLAILLRGTPVRQVVEVAEAGESMPAKSTFFHPKLPSGLVIHPLVG
jgi:uncharacterized protein (DUF1015 family)